MKTKAAVLLAGALIALLLLSRYFALSQTGVPLAWMPYLGLPITAAGVVFALQLINLGAGWATKTQDLRHDVGVRPQPPLTLAQPAVPVSERLRALQALRDNGAISEWSTARGGCKSSPTGEPDKEPRLADLATRPSSSRGGAPTATWR
jgi:hypothetical protein